MNNNYEKLNRLRNDIQKKIVSSPEEWKKFLMISARFNKYTFQNQLLIYEQRPDAKACATIDVWNKQLKCYVKRGSKGIQLVNEDLKSVRYVFDISDVEVSKNGKLPRLWKYDSSYENEIVGSLEEKFNYYGKEGRFSDYVKGLTDYIVETNREYYKSYVSDKNMEEMFKELVSSSMCYSILSRCNIPENEYIESLDLSKINRFNTMRLTSIVGAVVNDLEAPIFNAISEKIREIDKERENEDEHNLQKRRRLSTTEYRYEKQERTFNRQIRTNETRVSEEREEHQVYSIANDRRVGTTFTRDPKASGRNETKDSRENERRTGSDRRTESERSNEVGTDDEQYRFDGGGDCDQGDYQQLSLFNYIPSEQQQIESLEDEKNEKYTYINPKRCKEVPTKYLEVAIKRGTDFHNGKIRIMDMYRKNTTKENLIHFLKKEYGIGGVGGNISKDIPELCGIGYDAKGMEIRWKNNEGENTATVKWNDVEAAIRQHVRKGDYLSEKEKISYDQILNRRDMIRTLRTDDIIKFDEVNAKVIGVNEKNEIEVEDFDLEKMKFVDNVYAKNNIFWHDRQNRMWIRNTFLEEIEFTIERAEEHIQKRVVDEYYIDDTEIALHDVESDTYYLVNTAIDGYAYSIYDGQLELIDGNIYEGLSDFENIRDFSYTNFQLSAQKVEELNYSEIVRKIDAASSREVESGPKEVLQKDQIEKENLTNESKETEKLVEATNYHFGEQTIEYGSAKERFDANINAIKTLKNIEKENRLSTKVEQEILARYVGWGGLAQAFDEKNEKWSNEYVTLKELLTFDEYESARSTTLNAHYTDPDIIRSIYVALYNMGFREGKILEPSLGIGNFFGVLPENMDKSKLYGVEIDSLTGRIAKQLYPNADIQIKGYEDVSFRNDYFDIAIGNVPFGSYKVNDMNYKENYLIHDYFFAKTIDKVRSGGVIAFITSKGTLDKQNPSVRRYIAERTELLGAIRLPNNAFRNNAGTEVTADIIFLQKKDRPEVVNDDWIHLGKNEDGIVMNQYFIDHPDMILGEMKMVSGPYGMESTCKPTGLLKDMLKDAIEKVNGTYEATEKIKEIELEDILTADPNVRNYSYTEVAGQLYYRENEQMYKVKKNDKSIERIKGLIEIRDITRDLINVQLRNATKEELQERQKKLNEVYDRYTSKFGLINSNINKKAFEKDSSYYLLCSLELIDENGTLKKKADIFSKRTIRITQEEFKANNPQEALMISINEKGKIDTPYMQQILVKDIEYDDMIEQLKGSIFKNPKTGMWETEDEYLSGNVRKKLTEAEIAAESNNEYQINVEKLKQIQPKELEASEIEVRLGATWIEPEYIRQFVYETLSPPRYLTRTNIIDVKYSKYSGVWNITGKNQDANSINASVNYGTGRASAYRLIEDALNLKDTKIFDVRYEDGKEIRELNKKETVLAQQKQGMLKEQFKEWIFKEPTRRADLCKKYNEVFNSIRPREYNGENLNFPGMNAEIELKPNQKNAVARGIYGGNSLFAHSVGAGKTFAMAATCMKGKQLGISHKSMFVVPKSLVNQWANEFMLLYPGANLLVATAKDFEPANRKKFCSRIATGEYDAIIISHSQFDKIPLSKERQKKYIKDQINEITEALAEKQNERGEKYSIKQMELTRKNLEVKLEKLNKTVKKDNVVDFEELGIDRLFVDEAHGYKNLYLYTKMTNVAGISQSESEKATDMYNKCRYLNEITGNKGVIFATGTPVSNSMTELYTMMRYLQRDTLEEMNLDQFDAWASTFGETETAMELTVEGNSYRAKTRFSKFYNLPELISVFKEVADIQTADMLKLPVPEAEFITLVQKPSEIQKEILKGIAERAEKVHTGAVNPSEDNMLKITSDGRKLALDQRLINPLLDDNPESKVNACVNNVHAIWEDTKEKRSTQLIFSDLSTPNKNQFNVYDDIKEKLIRKGIPENEIEFIHNADTEVKKKELFTKVRQGKIRVLLGSTQKLGTGVNVQSKLIAVHHMDPPWRPSDIEQREGRIIRQGNENPKVKVFRYVTEGTFDAYSWQMLENKQKFIGQIMTSKSPVRSCNDMDESVLSFAEVKALATGNPYIKEKMDLEVQVNKLKLMKANWQSQKYRLEDDILKNIPNSIKELENKISSYKKDIELLDKSKDKEFSIKLKGIEYVDKKAAGEEIINICKESKTENKNYIGEYRGFKLGIQFDYFFDYFKMTFANSSMYEITLGADPIGNITKINNALNNIQKLLANAEDHLEEKNNQLQLSKDEVEKAFKYEGELRQKSDRLNELNAILTADNKVQIIDQEEIKNDLTKNGFQCTNSLVGNIAKLSMKEGKVIKLRDIKRMGNENSSEQDDIVNKIINECKKQELEKIYSLER